MQSRYSVFAIFTYAAVCWAIAYQSSSLNVMLGEVHGLDPQKSTLVYVGASFGFILGAPVAGQITKHNLMSRRGLTYVGYNLIAVGMVIRTGDFGDEPKLYLSITGQIVSGVGLAILLCTTMPELIDSIESQPELYDRLD